MLIIQISIKMLSIQRTGLCCDGMPLILFTKTTLPDKIIMLRKTSQEKHVRRMKLAHQKKVMQGQQNVLSCVSTPAPKRDLSDFITPGGTQRVIKNISAETEPCRIKRDKLFPANFDKLTPKYSHTRKDNNATRFTTVKHLSGESHEIKNNSKLKFVNRKCRSYNVNLRNGTKTNIPEETFDSEKHNGKTSKALKTPEHFVGDSQKQDVFDAYSKSGIHEQTTNDHGDFKNTTVFNAYRRGLSASKIPILSSRLNIIDGKKQSVSPILDNTWRSRKYSESLPSVHNYREKNVSDIDMSPLKHKQDLAAESLSDIKSNDRLLQNVNNTPEDKGMSPTKNPHNLEEVDGSLPNKMTSVSKWLENIAIGDDSGINSSESPLTSHEIKSFATLPNEKTFQPVLEKDVIVDLLNKGKYCENSYKKISNSSESKESVESFYGIKKTETLLMGNRKLYNVKEPTDMRFEDVSTVTVPSDKDLDLANHREAMFRNLPDYPNTPYYLRYPRYKIRDNKRLLKSAETEAGECSNRLKIHKSRKKSCNITPIRKKSNKFWWNLKVKKQILRNKDLSP